jgi:hypothetical protein
MGLSRLKELVSQAEKEGVSLGVMISQRMSPEEMELAQMELASEICANHASIETYMADVNVPSIDEIISRSTPRVGSSYELASDEVLA